MVEVAIRMPKPLGGEYTYNTWLYGKCPDVGGQIYRGAKISEMGVNYIRYTIPVYAPIDGVISHLSPLGGRAPDAGVIILKIKTSKNIDPSSSQEMAFFAFEEMLTLFENLSKKESVPSTETVKNCLKHAVSIHRI
ncbi:MAG: hypothetical protein KC643_31080 [Nitrospira sp.]|nr:hypothetical protein [Nitrospira sp.]